MTEPRYDLPPDAELVGVARCSEAEPQCVAVARKPNGDLVLANHVGAQLLIPAAEVLQVLTLMAGSVSGR